MLDRLEDLLPLFARRESLFSRLRDAARTKPELVRELDVSRSTVDRCLRELESNGLVARSDGRYDLTLVGNLLFADYQRFRDRGERVLEAAEVLSVLPPDADLDAVAVTDASVTVADRTSPYRPAEAYNDVVQGAKRIDHLSTALGPQNLEALRDEVVTSDLELRMAVSPSIIERLVVDYGDILSTVLDTGQLELRELESAPEFSLGVVECPETTYLTILVYADDGVRGFIRSDDSEAVAYGRDYFERYWEMGSDVSATVD